MTKNPILVNLKPTLENYQRAFFKFDRKTKFCVQIIIIVPILEVFGPLHKIELYRNNC